jgi:hypothetical protein
VARDHTLTPEDVEAMCEELLEEVENASTDEVRTHGPKAKKDKFKATGGPPEGRGGPPPWAGGGKNHAGGGKKNH